MADVDQSPRLAAAVAHRAKDRQCLTEEVQCFLLLTQSAVDNTDVVQCGRLETAIAHNSPDRQRLVQRLQRLLLIAQSGVENTDNV